MSGGNYMYFIFQPQDFVITLTMKITNSMVFLFATKRAAKKSENGIAFGPRDHFSHYLAH